LKSPIIKPLLHLPPEKEKGEAVYPDKLFWNLDLYTIFLGVGFFAAVVLFRILADRAKLPAKVQNLCLGAGVASMVGGYLFAVLFQGIYNAAATGIFSISGETGATFYGGLIGGVVTFLAVYLIVGRWTIPGKGEAGKQLSQVLNLGVCSVVIAHAFGRIGCLFAGCCHGAITSAWYGVWNAHLGAKTVPTQLFEALFLFALCTFLCIMALHAKKCLNLSLYLILYGIWRFGIEFFRADERGKTLIPWLTPSQFIAVVFVVFGIVLFVWTLRRKPKNEDWE